MSKDIWFCSPCKRPNATCLSSSVSCWSSSKHTSRPSAKPHPHRLSHSAVLRSPPGASPAHSSVLAAPRDCLEAANRISNTQLRAAHRDDAPCVVMTMDAASPSPAAAETDTPGPGVGSPAEEIMGVAHTAPCRRTVIMPTPMPTAMGVGAASSAASPSGDPASRLPPADPVRGREGSCVATAVRVPNSQLRVLAHACGPSRGCSTSADPTRSRRLKLSARSW